jgi:hypothetical protein
MRFRTNNAPTCIGKQETASPLISSPLQDEEEQRSAGKGCPMCMGMDAAIDHGDVDRQVFRNRPN